MTRCALCESPKIERETDSYLVCPACGTLSQVDPKESPLSDIPDDIYHHEATSPDKRWLSLTLERAGRPGRLLDLGCGNGAFTGLAREAGWEVRGVEKNPASVSAARELGLDVEEADLDEWTAPGGERFDAVRIWYVLEHVRQPGRLIKQAETALKPGGLMLIAVPNDAGWLSRRVMESPDDRFWEHPLHLHHFPPFGLEEWLGKIGFELILAEATRPTELMRGGKLPLLQAWEKAREAAPELCRVFYRLGVGRGRELLLRKNKG